MSADLDRYITGNYGEDQFKNMDRCISCINFDDEGYCPVYDDYPGLYSEACDEYEEE
jgi:hypothetical protein